MGLHATNYELNEFHALLSCASLYVYLIEFRALFYMAYVMNSTNFALLCSTRMNIVVDEIVCSDSLLLNVTCFG